MGKQVKIFLGIFCFVFIFLGLYVVAGMLPSVSIPTKTTPEVTSEEAVPFLTVPPGFVATYVSKDVPGARVMEWDSKGRIIVSQTKEGMVSVVEEGKRTTLLSDLSYPHGLALRCDQVCHLYVATHDALTRYIYDPETVSVSDATKLLSFDNTFTDRHKTRTLLFMGTPRENTLLISVGSSCNVCEDDGMRGKVLAYDVETKELTDYATGLRNAVFMTLNPVNGMVFLTEMGRDGLGDETPPDEVNILQEGFTAPLNFGWPICYGKNVHDTEFDTKTYIRNPCEHPYQMQSWLDIPAHSAPLGLSFIPEEGWPEEDWFDLLIAYHGSWNRSTPTGYKIVKVDIDGKGNPSAPEDFITGWLTLDGKKYGRPADIKVLPGGVVYISDDSAGAIYKVSRVVEE